MFGIFPLTSRPIPDDYDKVRSVFPTGVEATAGIVSDVTFVVTSVLTAQGNRFYIDGVENPTLTFRRGRKYIFDLSDSSNASHPLRLKDGDGNSFSSGVTVIGTQGTSGAKVEVVVSDSTPDDLRYYCTVHGDAMGNTISVADLFSVIAPANVAVTGISASGATNEARFVHFIDVTGVAATGQVGAIAGVSQGASTTQVGVETTGEVGSPAFSLDCVFDVSGVSAQAELGVPIRFETVEITGFGLTASVGDVVGFLELKVPVTGVGATGSTNSVTVTTEQNLVMDSIAATGGVGSVSVTGIANLTLTGVEGTAQVADLGTIVLNVVYPVDGVGSTGAVGTVGVAAGATLLVGSVSATMTVDQVRMYSSVVLDDVPTDELPLVDPSEDVPIEDVYEGLGDDLADEQFTEEVPQELEFFEAVPLDEEPLYPDVNPVEGEPFDDIWTVTTETDDVPTDPYTPVAEAEDEGVWSDTISATLPDENFTEVDVEANTDYSELEIEQEGFDGQPILDAA